MGNDEDKYIVISILTIILMTTMFGLLIGLLCLDITFDTNEITSTFDNCVIIMKNGYTGCGDDMYLCSRINGDSYCINKNKTRCSDIEKCHWKFHNLIIFLIIIFSGFICISPFCFVFSITKILIIVRSKFKNRN